MTYPYKIDLDRQTSPYICSFFDKGLTITRLNLSLFYMLFSAGTIQVFDLKATNKFYESPESPEDQNFLLFFVYPSKKIKYIFLRIKSRILFEHG